MQDAHDFSLVDPASELTPRPTSFTAAFGISLVGMGLHALLAVASWPGITVDLGIAAWAGDKRGPAIMFLVATIAVGVVLSIVALARYNHVMPHLRAHGYGLAWLALPVAVVGVIGSAFAFLASFSQSYGHGRRLRGRGKLLVPGTRASSAWLAGDREAFDVPDDVREELAHEWRQNACKEHASVAAFSNVALDLIAAGAPPRLITDAQLDALDEIRHARLCFSIARDLDGRDQGPAPFPEARVGARTWLPRPLALARLAVDAIVDGALNEGVSARILARLARRCEDGRVAGLLREIAADEARHAAHTWRIVDFCIDEGGETVVHALRGALRSLPETMTSPTPERARDGSWERWGVQGEDLERAEWLRARRFTIAKLGTLLDRAGAVTEAARGDERRSPRSATRPESCAGHGP